MRTRKQVWQGQKPSFSASPTKVSNNPTLGPKDPLYLTLISPWMQAAPGRGQNLGEGN